MTNSLYYKPKVGQIYSKKNRRVLFLVIEVDNVLGLQSLECIWSEDPKDIGIIIRKQTLSKNIHTLVC
jgi:hypothetical protein